MDDVTGNQDLRERPIGELMRQLADETATLVRQELELAKAEMREKGKKAGMGAGLFGGAGVVGLLALGALTAFFILVLDAVLPAWAAALIVAVVYGAIAAFLALRGRRKMQEAGTPVPEQTKHSIEEDLEWAKTRAKSGRR
jgi:uncharacterized membrane protein YqjE